MEERREMMLLLKRFEEDATATEDNKFEFDVEEGEEGDDDDIDELGKRWEGINLGISSYSIYIFIRK